MFTLTLVHLGERWSLWKSAVEPVEVSGGRNQAVYVFKTGGNVQPQTVKCFELCTLCVEAIGGGTVALC